MSKASWYRGFDNSPDGGRAKKAEGERIRGWNQEYRERQDRERHGVPPVEREKKPPVPYKPDPRKQPTRPVPMGPGDYGNGTVIDNDTGRRVPPPKNPFASPPVTRGGLPVNPRRWPRPRFPGLPWLDVIEAIDPLVFPDNSKKHPPILPPNYTWCSGPVDWPNYNWNDNPAFVWYGNCGLNPDYLPLDGQVAEPLYWVDDPAMGPWWMIKNDITPIYWWRNNIVPWPINHRGVVAGVAARVGPPHPDGLRQPVPYYPIISMFPPPDPNWMREQSPTPEYDPRPVYLPGQNATPGTVPAYAPEYAPTPDSPYAPDGQWQWDPATGGFSTPGTGSGLNTNTPGVPFVPIPPVTRAPPTSGEKQRKILTRSAKVGIALYKALDAASELAEVVDCVWEGLPKAVQKRWKQCKVNRMGDSFGQYGPDQADCKLRAVYHNFDKVDVEAVIKCIIKNELQDRIIGGMQAGLPKNTGNAHAEAEKRIAKWLDDIFSEELGL